MSLSRLAQAQILSNIYAPLLTKLRNQDYPYGKEKSIIQEETNFGGIGAIRHWSDQSVDQFPLYIHKRVGFVRNLGRESVPCANR